MITALPAYPISHPATCDICGTPINPADVLLADKNTQYSVCRSFDCRRILSQQASMTPAIFKAYLLFQKKLAGERKARELKQKQHIEEVTKREKKEHDAIQQFVLAKHPALSCDNTSLVIIPTGGNQLSAPGSERIADYTRHLRNIISQAAEHEHVSSVVRDQHYEAHEKLARLDQKFAEDPTLHTISDRLCTLCKGGCCTGGKDHAYISVITIRRYMDNHPQLSQHDVLDLYLSRVGEVTIEKACINQTATGCTLPRTLRSDVCNAFYCDPLKDYQQHRQTSHPHGKVLAIQRANHYWNHFALDACNDVVQVALLDEHAIEIVVHPKQPTETDSH